jgi:hypothetical protein
MRIPAIARGRGIAVFALSAAMFLAGCDKPQALGEASQILVAAPAATWQVLRDGINDALMPTMFTVRNESVFDVAHVDPMDEGWSNLRLNRQILLIGDVNDPVIAQALEENRGETPAAPAVFQVRNVWARNQLVTIALLPPDSGPAAAEPLLARIGEIYLTQFEEYAHARMFVSRPNEEMTDSLRRTAGFVLVVPNVYRVEQLEPAIWQFRNDQPDPSRLIRNITVASRPSGEVEFGSESAIEWRTELLDRLTQPPQVTESTQEWHELQVGGRRAIQIQGVWSNPPGQWPAAGPYIARMVDCGDRTFLVDAWLYAPGVSKYEYMYQLNTILGSFTCA